LCSVLVTKCYLGDQIKKNRWAEHMARIGERRGAYRLLVGRTQEIRPLLRPRRRWEYNIKMDNQEVR
jgi:hypothetical protein